MFTIRVAGEEDIEIIRILAHAIWPQAYADILQPSQTTYMLGLMYSRNALQEQFNKRHQFLLCYQEDTPVGFAAYSLKENNNSSIYRLHKLYVSTGIQGKGAGKFLLKHIIDTIKANGANALELNVNRHNKAFFFYIKMGFEVTGEEDIDIGQGFFMNDYIMKIVF